VVRQRSESQLPGNFSLPKGPAPSDCTPNAVQIPSTRSAQLGEVTVSPARPAPLAHFFPGLPPFHCSTFVATHLTPFDASRPYTVPSSDYPSDSTHLSYTALPCTPLPGRGKVVQRFYCVRSFRTLATE